MIDNRPIQKLNEMDLRMNEQEATQAEVLLAQIDMQNNQEEQDATLAEILLNGLGV